MTDDDLPHDGLPEDVEPGDRSAPAEPNASRPSRAKRHLRLVTATEEEKAEKPKANTKGKGGDAKTRVRTGIDPITGLTVKQAKFVEGIDAGMSLSDAYRNAYDAAGMSQKTIHEAACRLFSDGKVSARLSELSREKEAQRRMLTASDAAAAIETFRQMMTSAKTEAVRVRAAELLAKASGIFTDKLEVTDKTDRSTAEIEQAIKDRLARLGLTG